jgi:hypothetical protein
VISFVFSSARNGGPRSFSSIPLSCGHPTAWSGFLLFIGAGAFALGMAIHNKTLAAQRPPRPKPIYYCATGVEMPAFEPCKEIKGRRDI